MSDLVMAMGIVLLVVGVSLVCYLLVGALPTPHRKLFKLQELWSEIRILYHFRDLFQYRIDKELACVHDVQFLPFCLLLQSDRVQARLREFMILDGLASAEMQEFIRGLINDTRQKVMDHTNYKDLSSGHWSDSLQCPHCAYEHKYYSLLDMLGPDPEEDHIIWECEECGKDFYILDVNASEHGALEWEISAKHEVVDEE